MVNLMVVNDPRYSPDWAAIPQELLEMLAGNTTYLTTRQRAALNRIAAGRWFLVRNTWSARCEHCNRVHPYMTIRCVEGPFNGLRQVYEWIKAQAPEDRHVGSLNAEYGAKGVDLDMIVAISQRDAETYNQRIRDRGGTPVIDQRPLRPDELDEEVMREKIVSRARRIRAVAQVRGL